jgi:transposase-like protein
VPRRPKVEVLDEGSIDVDKAEAVGVVLAHADYPVWKFVVSVRATGEVTSLAIVPRSWAAGFDNATLSVRLEPAPAPGNTVTKRGVLIPLPLEELVSAARERVARDLTLLGSPEWARDFKYAPRPGRRGNPPSFYARVVADYLDGLAQGLSVEQIARRRGVERHQLNSLLHTAAERGVYKSAGPGRPGGHLTPEGKQALRQEQ